jgi:hypothetical protein
MCGRHGDVSVDSPADNEAFVFGEDLSFVLGVFQGDDWRLT